MPSNTLIKSHFSSTRQNHSQNGYTGLEKFDHLRLNPNEQFNEPEPLITIQGAVVGTLCNFSLIVGKAKSRKSFLATRFVIDFLSNNAESVLWFDTEQAKIHVKRIYNRILVGSNIEKDELEKRLEIYCLRSLSVSDIISAIAEIIESRSNIQLVIIDGIRDLVNSINSEEESTKISRMLLKWTEDFNLHIMAVLHLNKSNNNVRGHLGTELQNKAETVISIKYKDERISNVECEISRDEAFKSFSLFIEDNIPFSSKYIPNSSNKKGRIPSEFEKHIRRDLLIKIFFGTRKLSVQEFNDRLIGVSREQSINISQKAFIDWAKQFLSDKMMIQHGAHKSKAKIYELNT